MKFHNHAHFISGIIEVVIHTFIIKNYIYPLALLNPGVTLSSTTTSVTLTLSQPSSPGLPADQYTATLTSTACTNIPTRMETTTTGSVMISNLEAGIQYIVRVTASNTATGSTSVTTTAVTTQEAGMYIINVGSFLYLLQRYRKVSGDQDFFLCEPPFFLITNLWHVYVCFPLILCIKNILTALSTVIFLPVYYQILYFFTLITYYSKTVWQRKLAVVILCVYVQV